MHCRDLPLSAHWLNFIVVRRKETNCCDQAYTYSVMFDLRQTCGA
jgi:hypothetical protein